MANTLADIDPSILLTVGTGMQMFLAAPHLAASQKGLLVEAADEDDLVGALPHRERRQVKPELRLSWTPDSIEETGRHSSAGLLGHTSSPGPWLRSPR
ncbi:hypothetical protein BJ993_002102 [Nocardioides aromaticivorans]|uniref:Uncharacterized protein n=1 Tax=Nocardioides aromaticivorans TaxID=200618 RepID=A0A7Y9ZGH9_9ACTN|nr:hypothetical protein [Nocardioides aromaticivorans]NYI45022.1 hypothetical protein [Nocardioides aromaticivorans]